MKFCYLKMFVIILYCVYGVQVYMYEIWMHVYLGDAAIVVVATQLHTISCVNMLCYVLKFECVNAQCYSMK